jgi:hypothetical protein
MRGLPKVNTARPVQGLMIEALLELPSVTVMQAALLLGIDQAEIRAMCRNGELEEAPEYGTNCITMSSIRLLVQADDPPSDFQALAERAE